MAAPIGVIIPDKKGIKTTSITSKVDAGKKQLTLTITVVIDDVRESSNETVGAGEAMLYYDGADNIHLNPTAQHMLILNNSGKLPLTLQLGVNPKIGGAAVALAEKGSGPQLG